MKGQILIVDDEQSIRDVLVKILQPDYGVSAAANGAGLKQAFAREPADVVLLDLRLPDADGLDLLNDIKQHWPNAKVIVVTGYPSDDAEAEAGRRGAFQFMHKPFDPEVLLVNIESALGRKQATL